jgi:hypothetical protein
MISGIDNLLGFLLRDLSKIRTHERPLNKTEHLDALDHDM